MKNKNRMKNIHIQSRIESVFGNLKSSYKSIGGNGEMERLTKNFL